MPVVTDYTALLGGNSWNGIETGGQPVIVTYSFPTTVDEYVAGIEGFTAATVASFSQFSVAERVQARAALGEWASASGIIFIEVAPGKGDINFGLVDFDTTSAPSYAGSGGVGFYPFGYWDFFSFPNFSGDLDAAGDVFMNSQLVSGGQVNYGTLLHEIGHALGLKHPTEVVTNYAAGVTHDEVLATDDPTLTIMATAGGPPGSDHLHQLDMDAAAYLYGAAGLGEVVTANDSGVNAVSSWSWAKGVQTLRQTGFAGDDTIRGSSVTDVIKGLAGEDRLFGLAGDDTLEGGDGDDELFGGNGADRMVGGADDDTYFVDDAGDTVVEVGGGGYDMVISSVDFTMSNYVELLQLLGDGLTGTGSNNTDSMFGDGMYGSTLRGLRGHDYIAGGSGGDTLDGGDGNDQLHGAGGADFLTGGIGKDDLFGGSGADTFLYYEVDESKRGAARDVIWDWDETDRIDLTTLDANHTLPDLQSFVFIGKGTNTPALAEGYLKYYQSGGNTYVLGSVDGDGVADFQVELQGLHNLTGLNFLGLDHAVLTGTNGADTFTGTGGDDTIGGGNGLDMLSGLAGRDRLVGGRSADTLVGGADGDWFVFDAVADSRLGASTRDVIVDWDADDLIDLSNFDANDGIAGRQGFSFVGQQVGNAPIGAAELKFYFSGGNTFVAGGVDADGAAEFQIEITGHRVLTADDFLL